MNLLDRLKRESSAALDRIRAVTDAVGAPVVLSIVISHPGTVEDAILVGEHGLDELFAILTRLETGGRVECDVSATRVGPDEPVEPRPVQ